MYYLVLQFGHVELTLPYNGRWDPESSISGTPNLVFLAQRTYRRCAAQQALRAQVLVEVGPVDAVARAGWLPARALRRCRIEQPGKPGERDRDGAAVHERDAERVGVDSGRRAPARRR